MADAAGLRHPWRDIRGRAGPRVDGAAVSEYCYVGIKDCGCAVVMAVDDPRWKKETAKTVSQMVRDGYLVERWPIERARAECGRCKHAKATAEKP